jgi:hypothetical protein
MFSVEDIRKFVIRDTLEQLGEWSKAAENLLLATAIHESGLGIKLKCGRRLGLYQIGPLQHRSVWDDYLVNLPDKASHVRGLAGQHSFIHNPDRELVTNLRYATAIAWCAYLKEGCLLPPAEDIEQLAVLWRSCFRKNRNDSTQAFVSHYRQFCPGESRRVA